MGYVKSASVCVSEEQRELYLKGIKKEVETRTKAAELMCAYEQKKLDQSVNLLDEIMYMSTSWGFKFDNRSSQNALHSRVLVGLQATADYQLRHAGIFF